MRPPIFFSILVALVVAGDVGRAADVRVVAVTGEPTPDHHTTYRIVGEPTIDYAGRVAFPAESSDFGRGIVVAGSLEQTEVVRDFSPPPDANGLLRFYDLPYIESFFFASPAFDDLGKVVFRAGLIGTNGTRNGTYNDDEGIFSANLTALYQVAREGSAVPSGDGVFGVFSPPVLADAGQIAFLSTLRGTSRGSKNNVAVFQGTKGGLVEIVREGTPAGSGDAVFGGFDGVTVNDLGQVAFEAYLSEPVHNASRGHGIFRGDSDGLVEVVRTGQQAPNGLTIEAIYEPSLNDEGTVAFQALLSNSLRGIFRGDEFGIDVLVMEGAVVPDRNGSFSSFNDPVINQIGQAAFLAYIANTRIPYFDSIGIFRADGAGVVQVAREGDLAPGSSDRLGEFFGFALNDVGQAVFLAELLGPGGGTSEERGLYFFDDDVGHLEVVRTGQQLLGSTVVDIQFAGELGSATKPLHHRRGLNNFGQVAFHFTLADERTGVAVWDQTPRPLPADYNADGIVDLADYTLWRDSLGATGASLAADGNGDSVVDTLDFNVWKSNFGGVASSDAPQVAARVPEPAGGLILLVAAAVAWVVRLPIRR